MSTREIPTPHGPARIHRHDATDPAAVLVLGHGAGGGVAAPDLVRVTATALELAVSVVLVEQPYRVAGRRSPAPARQLDAAWTAILDHLRVTDLGELALLTGGRSSGARVACRTAQASGSRGVLCLAFPLRPPGRAGRPERSSRLPELDAVEVPTLVVQGERDPFGVPPAAPGRTVVRIAGDHSLRSDAEGLAGAVRRWLAAVVPGAARGRRD